MSKKQARFIFAMLLCTVLVFSAGCSNSGSAPESQNGVQGGGETEISGSIQIAGSTSVQPLSEELAMEFMSKYPKVKINVAGGGSGAGIKAAQEGTADIGASSRELKPEEKTVKEFVIAKDGIAIIINPQNPVEDLTLEQIKEIFSGKVTNWKDVGGKDAPITVVIREDGSGTRGAFQEIVFGKDAKFTDSAIVQNSTGALRTAVAGDPNAIGFISLGSLNSEVKAVKVDGIEVSKETVLNNSYKISRPFIYMTKDEPTGLVKIFLDFVLSPEGQKIVAQDFIPVK